MDGERRRQAILELARRTGAVDVGKLAADFGVSKETARRDLRVLEEHGRVRRTHGGAHPVESAGFETNLALRSTMHVPEKSRIAEAAVKLVGAAETLYIDEGFTPQLIAQALPQDRRLTVITASLVTAGMLATREWITVLLLGGRVRGGTLATVDHWATRMLSGFVIDLAFIGGNGIARKHGLTTPDPAVSQVKAQVMRVSRRRVFVGVHTKFGAVSFCRFADVPDLEAIITDTRLPATEAHRYSLLGPQVIRV
ncbi:DeoR/GlpR family DNA-binding transcription regulator [Streptomyces sp. NPDC051636]|uniref:DeoR/GlpR family DNA-binding transcription regulator n=1 Tax=Streptomyces sp. NPDC051636 TaxID=3365663 RepID=UPI0037A7880A